MRSLLRPPQGVDIGGPAEVVEHPRLLLTSERLKQPAEALKEDGVSPTTYEAIRIVGAHLSDFRRPVNAVYVEYANPAHELEYYNLKTDPFELHNTARGLTRSQRAQLHKILLRLENCHDARACWSAAMPAP